VDEDRKAWGWLKEIRDKVSRIYAPAPRVALEERPRADFSADVRAVLPDTGAWVCVYESPALTTYGYTIQNAFVGLGVHPPAPDANVAFAASFEGVAGSPWCQIAAGILAPIGYGGPGDYAFNLMSSDQSLATDVRVRVFARATQGAHTLDLHVDVAMAAGPGF
jgi:hypothetical protein